MTIPPPTIIEVYDKKGGKFMYSIKDICAFTIDGVAIVELDDDDKSRISNPRYTFIDKDGNLQDGRYRDAKSYREGLTQVMLDNGKFAIIDKEGKLQHDLLVRFFLGDEVGYIDKEGNYQFEDDKWLEYIKQHPEAYSKIPSHKLTDIDFMKKINETLTKYYTSAVEQGKVSPKDVDHIFSIIEKKNETAKKERQKPKENKQKLEKQLEKINSFFDSNFIDEQE